MNNNKFVIIINDRRETKKRIFDIQFTDTTMHDSFYYHQIALRL